MGRGGGGLLLIDKLAGGTDIASKINFPEKSTSGPRFWNRHSNYIIVWLALFVLTLEVSESTLSSKTCYLYCYCPLSFPVPTGKHRQATTAAMHIFPVHCALIAKSRDPMYSKLFTDPLNKISPYNRQWRPRGGEKVQLYFYVNLGARWGWVVNATPWPLYSREEGPVSVVQKAGWIPDPVWTGARNVALHWDSISRQSSP
jgi:hypothetical protein